MAKKFDAKAKAKRQKIILAVLGVVFVGVLAWQVPSVLKMMNEKPPVAASTPPPPATATPGAVPVAPAAPVSATPVLAGSLADSDPSSQAAGGQLVTFDRFTSKDPFKQQAVAACDPSECPAPTAPKAQRETTSATPAASARKPAVFKPSAPAIPRATIVVNGVREQVAVGQTFPADDPMFVLKSVSASKAKIGISGGSLDTGGGTVTLTKGKKLTLENTVDGARYVLVLVSTA